MSTIVTARQIDLQALPFPASQMWDDTEGEVNADVEEAVLVAAVAAAPTYVEPTVALRSQVEQATTVTQLRAALIALLDAGAIG